LTALLPALRVSRVIRSFAIALALVVPLGLGLWTGGVRAEDKRASPHDEASAIIGGKKVTIHYGRPYKKGRVIFGGLVPYGQIWRTGADEATTMTTEADLLIGTLRVPKGIYALFTLPEKNQWTLVVNKTAKQWGAFSYNPKEDLGRVPMTVAATAVPVEQFTIELVPDGKNKSTMKLSWDKLVASVPLTAP
jgi:hypothetical protein